MNILAFVAIGVGGFILYKVVKNRGNKVSSPQLIATNPLPDQQRTRNILDIAGMYNNINLTNEDYATQQRRQQFVSRVVKRIIEYSYYPIDSIKASHDIDAWSRERLQDSCEQQTIHDTIAILIFGHPTTNEDMILEDTAAKAYLKLIGIPTIAGVSYAEICP